MVKTCRAEVKKGRAISEKVSSRRGSASLVLECGCSRLGDLCARVGSQGVGSEAVLPGLSHASPCMTGTRIGDVQSSKRSFCRF